MPSVNAFSACEAGTETFAPTTDVRLFRTTWGDAEWYTDERGTGVVLFEGVQRAIDAYLDENGWHEGRCDCGERFYYKRGRDDSCQRRSCVDEFPFLEAGESNDFRGAATVGAELASEAASSSWS